jgi:hypothetical protein
MPFKLKHLPISNENRFKLIDYLELYVPLRIFHLYGDVTIAGEGRAAKFRHMLGAQSL